MRVMMKSLALAGALFAGVAGSALAQEMPKTALKVVGAWGNLTQYKSFEQPFWTKEISEKSKGAITAEITPFNEMGLKGAEIFRLMRLGVIDFGSTVLGYVAADDARNEAVDLAGLSPDVATARKVSDAYKPVYDKFYRERFGVQVLGIWPYSAQVLFCNGEIKGLADLKGKKVRTGNRTLAEFVEALGGTGVTLAFNEVVPALQNKVVDCAITGTLSGNSAKWYEVATHIYALPLGWSHVMHAVNVKSWDKLNPQVRSFLQAEIASLEDRIWKAAAEETQQGYDCNAGKDNCTMGVKAKMTVVPVSEADKALLKKVMAETVVPKWAARCAGDCVPAWNDSIGKIVGITAKAN
ncbi:TRAP transporter substrate-binding protein [Ferrovibrio sp.]|uniref:TRAP transporter substrate-binding protein n=1 Tax=Ferrovibrio sp. TaxID=1917215 RepID=UPI001B54466C|nr:TRAP transporter substrate-binding protein [Ferrovibrio sp.]MBP7063360.1 TRAP transporter substrate-binding protein [Ferrovibrio sp.]